MRKFAEIANQNSCWNKAGPREMVFVLLGRDASAPAAIRAWCKDRIKRKKNLPGDYQIKEALDCAMLIEDGFKK